MRARQALDRAAYYCVGTGYVGGARVLRRERGDIYGGLWRPSVV
jgi:hypothetical protein